MAELDTEFNARLTIERLGLRGDGVAAGPVYATGTLPAEVVTGAQSGDRIDRPKIITPSLQRVRPPCPHAGACGGCALQHASDAFVADWKISVVRDQLSRAGLAAPMRPIRTSPEKSRIRATLAGKRTNSGAIVGFHGRASTVVVETPDCRVLHPALTACRPFLAEIVQCGATRRGELAFALTKTDSDVDVAVSGGRDGDRELFTALVAIAERGDFARISWNGQVVAARRPVFVGMGAAIVPLPPGAFLQATRQGAAALVEAVLEATNGAKSVVDLFSGVGTFALPMARFAQVHAVDSDLELLAALDAGWRSGTGLRRVTTEARHLYRRPLEADELTRFDAAVIDPPRAGAAAQIDRLCGSKPVKIAYTSCNPVTFARDARALNDAGFGLDWVQVVDQFRWSSHIELVGAFSR